MVAGAGDALNTQDNVRRNDAGIDAAASWPTMPKARRSGRSSSDEAARMSVGARSEKPATTKITAM